MAATRLAATLIITLSAIPGWAQSPEPDPPQVDPPTEPEAPAEPASAQPVQPTAPAQPAPVQPAPQPVQQPAAQPTPQTAPPPAQPAAPSGGNALSAEPFTRENTFGFGPALVFFPPQKDNPDDTWDLSPGLSLQHRKAKRFGGSFVGYEWTNDIVFHDWKAMRDAYGWYFDKPEATTSDAQAAEDNRAMRVSLLWPGLFFIPFGAANYTTGMGLVFFMSPHLPSVYLDAGFNLNLWLRLSDPDFRADFGFGLYGGLGADIMKNVGVNVRVSWGTPFVHTLIKNTQAGITTALLNINFAH